MKISENLIEKALKRFNEIVEDARNLVGFSEKDGQILRDRAEILKSWSDDLVDDFYSHLLKYPKTAGIFEKIPVEQVKKKFKNWYEELVSGKIDETFLKRQFYVGLVHIYFKIDNDIMIFSANNLKRKFLEKCFTHFEPEEAAYVFQAFSKLVDFVIALTVEGYEFALYEGLIDIAGFKPSLVERMMEIKIKEMYEIFKKDFLA